MNHLHSALQSLTDRVIERSCGNRAAYLALMTEEGGTCLPVFLPGN